MLTATGLPMRLASRWPSAPFCKKSHVDCKYRLYAAKPSQQSSGVELITSNGNSFVKHCVKLRESAKYRQEARRVLVVGQTPIKEILDAQPELVARTLLVPQGKAAPEGLRHQALVQVSAPVLRKLTGLDTPDSITAVAELDLPGRADLRHRPGGPALTRLLALEGVQDPGNLGTLLRTACAFGWDAVLLLPGCCDPYNDKALRASRGAAFKLPVAVATAGWPELLELAAGHGMKLIAAEPELQGTSQQLAAGPSLLDLPVCLVLGSEGKGLSATALQHCAPVAIPMAGDMESLNVGIAGGILMFMMSAGLGPLVDRLRRPL